ncbi:hypothetical protein LCGC14_2692900, partial [marine sediment metagenome]
MGNPGPRPEHSGNATICLQCAEKDRTIERQATKIKRLQAGYHATGLEGAPCPGCVYE